MTVTIRVSPQDAKLIYDTMQERLASEELWEPERKREEAEETLKECEEAEKNIERIEAILETLKRAGALNLHQPFAREKVEIQLSTEDAKLIREELTEAKERLGERVKQAEAILQTLSQAE